MGIRMRAKIAIAFLSISLLTSFGLASNQAFANLTCEECLAEFDNCPSGDEGIECRTFWGNCIEQQMCKAVGGEMIQIETTPVLAAGAQYTAAWMIPVIVSGIGIAIVIARKF